MLFIVIINLFFSLAYCKDGFDNNCLESHNEFRRRHGSPPMKWSESLAAAAQKWADKLAREDKFEHDIKTVTSQNQGENLAFFSPPKKKCMGVKSDDCVQCSEMVTDWYNEVKDYDFNTGKPKSKGKVVLHFTQVVWKASVELGVGVGIGKKYGFITVARYSPRGNMGDAEDFKKNVFPEGATPPVGPSTTPQTTPSTASTGSSPGVTGAGTTPAGTTPQTTFSTTASTLSPTTYTNATTKKPEGSNCEYFVITTITKEQKIIQKCNGKPNITFIPSFPAKPKPPQQPATQRTTQAPTTIPATVAKSTTSPSTSNQTSAPSAAVTTGGSTIPTTAIPTGISTGQPTTSQTGGSTGQPSALSTSTRAPIAVTSNTGQPSSKKSVRSDSSTGPTNTPTPKAEVDKEQHDKSIMLINLYRVLHGAAPLVWNKQLADEAQSWAEKLAQKGTLDHDTSLKDGETIAKLPASNKDVMNAVDAWYDEEKQFDYKNPGFSKATGHFTQIVWKASKEMGLGITPSKDNSEYYIVARFKPSGNIQGRFAANVGAKVII